MFVIAAETELLHIMGGRANKKRKGSATIPKGMAEVTTADNRDHVLPDRIGKLLTTCPTTLVLRGGHTSGRTQRSGYMFAWQGSANEEGFFLEFITAGKAAECASSYLVMRRYESCPVL